MAKKIFLLDYGSHIGLVEKHPWILEFSKLSGRTNSIEVNVELENRTIKHHSNCYPQLFDGIDESRFRKNLDLEKCKQIILWSNIGFINQVLDDIRNSKTNIFHNESITEKIGNYFNELRKYFIQHEMHKPIIVEFPLRGEWLAPNTPGTKIPSHSANKFGTRYAYDFIQVDWDRMGWPAYRTILLNYLLSGIPLHEYYC